MSDTDRPDQPDDWAGVRAPFLDALSAADRQRLLSRATVRRLRRGQAAWEFGTTPTEFLFVVRGRVKLVNATAEGREAIVDLRTQGQLLCSGATCVAAPYCCTAIAQVGGVEVVTVPRADLLALLEDSPAAAQAFLRDVGACTMALCHRVEDLTSGSVERRLAMLLLRLTDRLGVARGDGMLWVPVALSRQDLADMCNAAVESAIRAMSRLSKNGIVDTRPGGFLVRDRAALAALAVPRPRA